MPLGPLMLDLAGTELTQDERERLAHPLVGGVILFARNFESATQLTALVASIRALRTPPLLIAVDHEGGRVQRFRHDFSPLPSMRRIGREYDMEHARGRELARLAGWLLAAELRAVGIDLAFAPVVDLEYGLSEVIGDRAFHADPGVVAVLAGALMAGMRDAGMSATAKHFPGHGAVAADSHVALPVDRRERADLEADLLPYRRLIANGLPAVMVAHVLYPAVDSVPASFSRRWIEGVLRTELQFAGLVLADDLTMAAAAAVGDLLQRAQRALAAGCDVLPVCNDRPGAERLLDRLKLQIDPASQLRLVRMRGRSQARFENLCASAAWQSAREWLLRSASPPPELSFSPEGADARGTT